MVEDEDPDIKREEGVWRPVCGTCIFPDLFVVWLLLSESSSVKGIKRHLKV